MGEADPHGVGASAGDGSPRWRATAAGAGGDPWLVAALTLLAAATRLVHLGTTPLWTDEAFSLWMAKHSLPAIWRWTERLDAHPPLYYMLLHVWLAFGDREAPVRMLSVAAGTLTIPAAYLFGRATGGRRVGVVTALLLAVSPFHIWYSQEARMYPLLMLAATIALLGLALLLREPPPRGAWTLYVAGMTAALWTEHSAALLLGTANLILLLRRPPHLASGFARRWAVAQALVVALWSPALLMLLRQLTAANAGPTSLNMWGAIASLLPDAFSPLFGIRPDPPAGMRLGVTALALCVTVPLIVRGLLDRGRNHHCTPLIVIMWALPVTCAVLLGLVWLPVLTPATLTAGYRTLMWTALAPYLLIAGGLLTLRPRSARIGAVILLLVSGLAGLGVYYRTGPKWEAWDAAARSVAGRAAAGDVILFDDNLVQLPFDYYFHRYALRVAEHGIPRDFPAGGGREPQATAADLSRLGEQVRPYRRVWLIYSHEWWTDPHRLVPDVLARTGALVDEQTFAGLPWIRVYLFIIGTNDDN